MGTLYNADHTPIDIHVESVAEFQAKWDKRENARGYAEENLAHDSKEAVYKTYAERLVRAFDWPSIGKG
jgi:hypothetical protein